jgi:putative ABC transport system substrate-binding protein
VLLAAGGTPAARAAKAATATIPIVFSAVADPVGLGLVPSLSRPGGNMTGMSNFNTTLGGKRVELMRELVPDSNTFAYLVNAANPGWQLESEGALLAANTLGLTLHVFKASTESDLVKAFDDASARRVGALAASGEAFFDSRRELLVALARSKSLPVIYGWREYVIVGGLMSYGSDLPDSYRQAAIYCGRILKGEKPADLPVMQPIKFSMAINVKTARTLGMSIAPPILARADEVIE